MSTRKKLFISYAHKDRDFARQLADALKAFHDVWIDEDKLTVGDSLFAGIADGLANCDFGVVILSEVYMERTWTARELGGLLAIEEKTRKVILPVWKDVTELQVKKFSGGMLNDRLGVNASDGIAAVVTKLRAAVEVGSRSAELTKKRSLSDEFSAIGRDIKAKAESHKLLRSPKGGEMVRTEFERALAQVQETLTANETDQMKFKCHRANDTLIIHTGWSLTLRIDAVTVLENGEEAMGHFSNSADLFVLRAGVYERGSPRTVFDERPAEPPSLNEQIEMKPNFEAGAVVWQSRKGTSDAAEAILTLFLSHIKRKNHRE